MSQEIPRQVAQDIKESLSKALSEITKKHPQYIINVNIDIEKLKPHELN
ncbi:hypothetical protein ACFSTE_15840 [Aquimarina hainanensis]|uniref:4-oxalocrotonate tautomerase n=1 Tax=Aquimarina hainanensis TaxID=1578017 RepID=A0ABW5N9L4_9FLAO